MKRELLDISGKLDANSLHVVEVISVEAAKQSVEFLIVGAAARDMLMHHYYGVPIERATSDVDFVVDVPDWAAYESLTDALIARGFEKTGQQQRLQADNKMLVDIVPFGSIADTKGDIQWPPDGDFEMNVLGFQEAREYPVEMIVRNTPELVVPVVSVPGFLLLKLIAWGDREKDRRPKDAIDVKYIIQKYGLIDPSQDSVWTQPELIEKYEGNTDYVAAQLLGHLVSNLARDESRRAAKESLNAKNIDAFCTEMSPRGAHDIDENHTMMDAFVEGLSAQ